MQAFGAQALGSIVGSSLLAAGTAHAVSARSALVIGNAWYEVAPLGNAVNDSRLMTRTLLQLGFDVQSIEDATLVEMGTAIRDWLIASADASVRAFYFAGHGTQYRGENYLVPVGLDLRTEADLQKRALKLSTIVKTLSSQHQGVNFVFIDACRTDPSALFRAGSKTRSADSELKPGFTPADAPTGTVISFSTSPGEIATDGAGKRNSMFTQALAEQLKRPGVPVETLFKRVRVQVMQATRNTQVPWESSSLVGEFCFVPGRGGQCGFPRKRISNNHDCPSHFLKEIPKLFRANPNVLHCFCSQFGVCFELLTQPNFAQLSDFKTTSRQSCSYRALNRIWSRNFF